MLASWFGNNFALKVAVRAGDPWLGQISIPAVVIKPIGLRTFAFNRMSDFSALVEEKR